MKGAWDYSQQDARVHRVARENGLDGQQSKTISWLESKTISWLAKFPKQNLSVDLGIRGRVGAVGRIIGHCGSALQRGPLRPKISHN